MRTPARAEMSQARLQMMARRRRALGFLIAGLVLAPLAGLVLGSSLAWVVAVLFAIGLAGYLLFLRSQAHRDRVRREHRQARAPLTESRDYEATSAEQRFTDRPEAVVQIDEDDIRLDHFDTVDLTGLYTEDEMREDLRRAG